MLTCSALAINSPPSGPISLNIRFKYVILGCFYNKERKKLLHLYLLESIDLCTLIKCANRILTKAKAVEGESESPFSSKHCNCNVIWKGKTQFPLFYQQWDVWTSLHTGLQKPSQEVQVSALLGPNTSGSHVFWADLGAFVFSTLSAWLRAWPRLGRTMGKDICRQLVIPGAVLQHSKHQHHRWGYTAHPHLKHKGGGRNWYSAQST